MQMALSYNNTNNYYYSKHRKLLTCFTSKMHFTEKENQRSTIAQIEKKCRTDPDLTQI